jgi:hypothetical protein
MEDGGWRMEDGGWRMEDGGWRIARNDVRTISILHPPSSILYPRGGVSEKNPRRCCSFAAMLIKQGRCNNRKS